MMNQQELEDLIAEAIDDSMDMDWTSRDDGARAVFRVLYAEGLLPLMADDQARIDAAWEIHKAAGPNDHPNATDYRNRAERAEAELAEVRAEVERLRAALLEVENHAAVDILQGYKSDARWIHNTAKAALNGGKHD